MAWETGLKGKRRRLECVGLRKVGKYSSGLRRFFEGVKGASDYSSHKTYGRHTVREIFHEMERLE